ncbi:MAG: phage holin family protein [Candidatus Dormibacter sp.]
MTTPGGPRDESLAAIAREIADDAVRLAKAEIEFAKVQAIASIKRFAVAIGFLVAASILLLFVAIFALGAVPTALAGDFFSGWVWWLLMAAVFLLLGGFAGFLGYRSLRRGLSGGRELVGAVKEDVSWFKRLARRNASES